MWLLSGDGSVSLWPYHCILGIQLWNEIAGKDSVLDHSTQEAKSSPLRDKTYGLLFSWETSWSRPCKRSQRDSQAREGLELSGLLQVVFSSDKGLYSDKGSLPSPFPRRHLFNLKFPWKDSSWGILNLSSSSGWETEGQLKTSGYRELCQLGLNCDYFLDLNWQKGEVRIKSCFSCYLEARNWDGFPPLIMLKLSIQSDLISGLKLEIAVIIFLSMKHLFTE